MATTHDRVPEDAPELRQDLAAALRLAVRHNMHEGICNHFSVALDDHRFLLNPFGIHWSRICASDIITVDERAPDDAAELTALCIHRAVHKQHPRGTCVLHTHMPYATALTCTVDPELKPIHQNSLRFYDDVAYDNDYNGLVDDGDPDGGGSCSTGELGVCSIGTQRCLAGTVQCVRNAAPSVEMCDGDRKSTRLNSSHSQQSRMPSSA